MFSDAKLCFIVSNEHIVKSTAKKITSSCSNSSRKTMLNENYMFIVLIWMHSDDFVLGDNDGNQNNNYCFYEINVLYQDVLYLQKNVC